MLKFNDLFCIDCTFDAAAVTFTPFFHLATAFSNENVEYVRNLLNYTVNGCARRTSRVTDAFNFLVAEGERGVLFLCDFTALYTYEHLNSFLFL
jgi:hypothetical protein